MWTQGIAARATHGFDTPPYCLVHDNCAWSPWYTRVFETAWTITNWGRRRVSLAKEDNGVCRQIERQKVTHMLNSIFWLTTGTT